MRNMKKIHIIGLFLFSIMATSCMQTLYVPTAETFKNANDQIAVSLNKDGYRISNQSSVEKNEMVVTDQTYNSRTGYSNKIDNNFVNYDSYTFTSQTGETVSYSTKYSYKNSINGELYLKEMNLTECKVSNPDKYSQYCGNTGSIKRELEASRRDVRDLNIFTTTVLTCGVLVGVTIVLALLFPETE